MTFTARDLDGIPLNASHLGADLTNALLALANNKAAILAVVGADPDGDGFTASEIGLVDAGNKYTATQLEAGMAEVKTVADDAQTDATAALAAAAAAQVDADTGVTNAATAQATANAAATKVSLQQVEATPGVEGAVTANTIEVVCALKDLAGAAITTQPRILVKSVAATPDKGDLAAAATPVGTAGVIVNPATGANYMMIVPTAGGLFTFAVANDQAEDVIVEITGPGVLPQVLNLTFGA
jgi:hypothetical protein